MARSAGCTIQCVVAGSPSRMPAAGRIIAPVQTDVVQRVVSCTCRSQAVSSLSTIVVAVRGPEPGTSTMSGRGVSAYVWVMPRNSTPLSVTTGPGSGPTNRISASGSSRSTSYGPTASRAVIPGYSTIAICMGTACWVRTRACQCPRAPSARMKAE